jgi:hypothetical protein
MRFEYVCLLYKENPSRSARHEKAIYLWFVSLCIIIHSNKSTTQQPNSSAGGRGRAGWPDHDQQRCYHHAPTVKPEAATAVVELLMMDVRTPETRWAVHKLQVINLRNCCIWLIDLFELYDDVRTCKFWILKIYLPGKCQAICLKYI